jgi:hypothetical protein
MKIQKILYALILCLGIAAFMGPVAVAQGGFSTNGPDVIVGDIYDPRNFTPVGGIDAFGFGTISCNIGSENLEWVANNNRHPVIGQSVFRLHNNKFEMIGQSWLKHGFTALAGNLCDSCNGPSGTVLGVGCSDPYSGSLNTDRGRLGPKWEVNASSGKYTYPYTDPGPATDSIYKRLQIHASDLSATTYPGATYYVEAQYVTFDDAQAGNKDNNSSWREINFTDLGGGDYDVSFASGSNTVRMETVIHAWAQADPNVELKSFDVPGEGRFWVGRLVTDNGNGTKTYE